MKSLFFIGNGFAAIQLTKWIFIIGLSFPQLAGSAQPQKNIQFHHFSEEQGMPNLNAGTIFQDKKGYIWLDSKRYDGTSLKTFHRDSSNKNSFVPEEVYGLCNDAHGNLWGLAWNGIFKYDPDTEIFTEYFARDTVFPPCWVTCLTADKQGRVWFGMGTSCGVGYSEPPFDRLVDFSKIIYPDTLCNRNVSSLLFDHNGLLWIGTSNGINIYDPIHKKIKLFDTGDKNFTSLGKNVDRILEDHAGNMWISFHNEGIYRYNPSNGSSKFYSHSATDNNSLCSNNVRTLIEDSHHNLWAGSYEGISVYQPATDNFRSYEADPEHKYSLSSDRVSTLFEDRSGAMWIGTNGGGVNICYPGAKNFLFYENTNKKEAASSWATDLNIDKTGKIYMATFGAGLKEFDPVSRIMKSYKIVLPNNGDKADYFFGIFESSDGNIWLAGLDDGLHQLDRKSARFTTIHSRSKGDVFTCIAEDLDKRLWIGANGELNCYDMKTKRYFRSKELYSNTGKIHSVTRLYCDREGILWIAYPFGLTLLDTKTGSLRTFKHDNNNPHSLVDDDVNSFYDDGKGKVWIGTRGGLSEFDKRSEQFVCYTIKDGLPSNFVGGIVPDEAGNLWLGTGSGICKFSPPSSKNTRPFFRNYNSGDGLPGDGFSWGSKGPDGTIYFVCREGIVAFKPEDLNDNDFVPPVVITGLTVNNKSIQQNDSTGILKFPFGETRKIGLSYRQNDFSFNFSAFNYVHSKKNRFAYKLEPYDKDWRYTDAAIRFATYTNIDPGEYIFRVIGSNNDGVWNEEGAYIKLIIAPPYWQTWWFRLLCTLAAVMILYAIYYNRLQKLRDILRIRNKIASDLHDDLGATLSSISIMSELVNQQVKDQSPEASSLLEKIGNSSRNMIESVNDMVWAINPQNDNFENIIKRMRGFAAEILAARDIAFHFDFDKNLVQSKLKMEMRRNFYLIFKEAVNNAAKYSGAANTYVMIWNRENNLKMTIRDDGSGFEMKTVKAGNGLTNMQQRAELMKARFNLESIPGKGTIVELEFKSE